MPPSSLPSIYEEEQYPPLALVNRINGAPPEPERWDYRIRQERGATLATNLMKESVRSLKNRPQRPLESRLVELIRENGAYRQEIIFYRTCFTSAQVFTEEVRQIWQDMFVAYLADRITDTDWFGIMNRLERVVNNYDSNVVNAEDDWVKFWRIRSSYLRSEGLESQI